MKSAGLKLFYSPMCSICPRARQVAREVAEEEGVWLEEINILSPAGEEASRAYGIQGVPMILVNERYRVSGIPDKDELVRLLRKDAK